MSKSVSRSCWILAIYVIQHIIPSFRCSVRNECVSRACNLFMGITGTVIVCFVKHGACLFSQFHGYIRSSRQQKVTETLRVGVNILQTVILFFHLRLLDYFWLWISLMGCFFYLHRLCASTSLLESQVEAKIKNDLYKCMYLYISILKRKNMGNMNVWICSGNWVLIGN